MPRRGSYRKNEGKGYKILAAAVTLCLLGGSIYLVSQKNRTIFADASNQVLGVTSSIISAPQKWFFAAGDYISSYFGNATTIRKLKEENRALLEWRDEAKALAERLSQYEQLNNINDEQIKYSIIGRMIGEVNGPFSHSGIINVGSNDGISTDWIAINEHGMVGRVISVGPSSSRILLLTDSQSRIAVMGEETRGRAMMIGDKSSAPLLSTLNTPNIIKNGERIITSGDDGVVPRGIMVGFAGIAPDKKIRVRLNTNNDAIDFVKLIKPNNIPAPQMRVTNPKFAAPQPSAIDALTANASNQILPDENVNGVGVLPADTSPNSIAQAQEIKKLKAQRDSKKVATPKPKKALTKTSDANHGPIKVIFDDEPKAKPSSDHKEPTKESAKPAAEKAVNE